MDLINLIFIVIIFVISISLHEYAHALVSYKLWDPTPKIEWRLTPSPFSHVDPIGLLAVFLLGFGRGRPVNINPSYYKHQARDELFVALAWPLSNIIMALVGWLIALMYSVVVGYANVAIGAQIANDMVLSFWYLFGVVNIALALFNMIPLPPLDGFRIIKMFFPGLALKIILLQREIALSFLFLFVFLPLLGIHYFRDFLTYLIWIPSETAFSVFYGLLLSPVFY